MSIAEMAAAFDEWMRRFIDEPDRFEREFETVNTYLAQVERGSKPTYGKVSAAYLTQLADEARVA